MPDHLSPSERSRNMAKIKGRNTVPELAVRRLIHKLGFRFRLHYPKLIGKPDIVLPRHKKIVLVHGCFWHLHDCKRGQSAPKTNADFWSQKRLRNAERDAQNLEMYDSAGWKTLILWECEIRDSAALERKLISFISD
jgi:DNA mismatch endonuclease, patch repair protein